MKVLIAVLCSAQQGGGWLSPLLCLALLRLQQDPRFDLTVEMVMDQRPVEYARNLSIVRAREMNAAACVQIDHDNVPPSNFGDILHEALSTGKHAVGLAYGALLETGPQVIPYDNGRKDGQFRSTGCTGGGVLIVSAEVWRRIRGPWFKWVFNDDEVLSRQLGEDYFFAQLLYQHGLTLWTHECVAGHLKVTNVTRWILHLTHLQDEEIKRRGGVLPINVINPPVFIEG